MPFWIQPMLSFIRKTIDASVTFSDAGPVEEPGISFETILIYYILPLAVLLSGGLIRLIWLWLRKYRPRVLVHKACFLNNPTSYYFIKIQNRALKDITLTHVWVRDNGEEIHIIDKTRPLPTKLSPTDEWETWIEEDKISDKKNVYSNVRVKLSDDRILKSKFNKNVPSHGFVAGGTGAITESTSH